MNLSMVMFLLVSGFSLARETVEVVTVTASKEKLPASEVPLSLSVLQGDGLEQVRSSGMDIRFMTNRAPSLQAMSGFGRMYPYLFIRGLGNTDFDMNASQPVSVVHDGIVLENPWLKGNPIFDVNRIEILRGPQGTLFGRNTPAGIVKVETARPTQDLEGYGRLSYGSFGSVNFEGAVSGALVPAKLAARLSLLVEGRDDWIDNTHTREKGVLGGYDDLNGRVQFLWTPGENFSARFSYHRRDLDAYARDFHANLLQAGKSGSVHLDFRRDRVAHDGKNAQELIVDGASVELTYEMEDGKLVSLTGWERLSGFTRGDVDGGFGTAANPPTGPRGSIPFTSETADRMSPLVQLSQELRLERRVSKGFGFQLGAFYFDEKLKMHAYSYDTLGGGGQNGHIYQEQSAKAWALFAATRFDLSDKLEASAGLRFSKDEKEHSAERSQSPIGGGALAGIKNSPKDTVPSWDVSVRYRMAKGVNPYARLASSFRPPSVQGRLLFGNDVTVADTEKIISAETGVKLGLWDQRLHLTLAAYHFWMSDQQLTAGSGSDNANRLVNAKRTIGRGLEGEGTLALDGGLDLSFGASYNYTRIDDPNLFVRPCGSNCTVLDPAGGAPGFVSIDGNSLPQAARWMANFNLSYTHNFTDGSKMIATTDWIYRSRVNFFLYDSLEFRDSSLVEGGVSIGWRSPSDRWEAALFGRNILNDVSATGGIDFNNLAGFVNEPPFWGLRARYLF